jgi:uncharacterized protein (TIGR00369 family)
MTKSEKLIKLFNSAPITKSLGFSLSYDGETSIIELPYSEAWNHPLSDVHGGIISTLLDTAGWFSMALGYENFLSTIEYHTRLHEPAKRQKLIAIGWPIRRGKNIGVAEMKVETADGRLIATGSGTYSTTSISLEVPA